MEEANNKHYNDYFNDFNELVDITNEKITKINAMLINELLTNDERESLELEKWAYNYVMTRCERRVNKLNNRKTRYPNTICDDIREIIFSCNIVKDKSTEILKNVCNIIIKHFEK